MCPEAVAVHRCVGVVARTLVGRLPASPVALRAAGCGARASQVHNLNGHVLPMLLGAARHVSVGEELQRIQPFSQSGRV